MDLFGGNNLKLEESSNSTKVRESDTDTVDRARHSSGSSSHIVASDIMSNSFSPKSSFRDSDLSNLSGGNNGKTEYWYPGKYILRASKRAAWTKPKIEMDKEQAQSMYADLFASGENFQLPASETLIANAANVDFEHLIQENSMLKDEIEKLKEDLKSKESIIAEFEATLNSSTIKPKLSESEFSIENFESVHKPSFASNLRRRRGRGYFSASSEPNDEDEGLLFGEEEDVDGNDEKAFQTNILSNSMEKLLEASVDVSDNNSSDIFGPSFTDRKSEEDVMTALVGNNLEKYDPLKGAVTEQLLQSSMNFTSKYGYKSDALSNFAKSVENAHPISNSQVTNKPRAMFAKAGDPKEVRSSQTVGNSKEMSYTEFLSLFSSCLDLVDITRRFLMSTLGPTGDTTPPKKGQKVDYIFYGVHKLEERCRDFFDEMQEKFKIAKPFKGISEDRLFCARDALEQYVMHRLGEFAFKSVEVAEEDELLMKRMKLLSFLTLESLDIKKEIFVEDLLSLAIEELRHINDFKTPGDKVECVVKCVTIIFRSLSVAKANYNAEQMSTGSTKSKDGKDPSDDSPDMNIAGADDFLPLFIWVVLHCRIPKLFSNCEYIQAYLNPARLMSKSGYCLINLRSAIEFVMYVEPSSLNMDPSIFEEKLEAEQEKLLLEEN